MLLYSFCILSVFFLYSLKKGWPQAFLLKSHAFFITLLRYAHKFLILLLQFHFILSLNKPMSLLKLNPSTGLFILRVAVGLLMLTHGYPKLVMLVGGGPIAFAGPIGIGQTVTLAIAVFAEFLCSIFIIVGFKVRLAAIPLAATMATAALIVHGNDPFGKKEMALMYLVAYLILIFCGGGTHTTKE